MSVVVMRVGDPVQLEGSTVEPLLPAPTILLLLLSCRYLRCAVLPG